MLSKKVAQFMSILKYLQAQRLCINPQFQIVPKKVVFAKNSSTQL